MNYQLFRDIVAARPRSLAFLAFLAVLTLALWFYLANWQRPQLEKAQGDWTAKRVALAQGQTVGTASRYERGLRELALFEKRIIPKKEFPNFLSRLYDAAKDNSLALSSISYKPTPVKEDPTLITYAMSFSVTGKYGSVKKFIGQVSGLPEMVTLDSLSLNSTSQTEESVDLKVQLTAYLKKEGA